MRGRKLGQCCAVLRRPVQTREKDDKYAVKTVEVLLSLFVFFFFWYQHLRFSGESGVEDLLFFSFSFLSQQQANLAKNPSFDSDELLAVWCFIEDAGAGIDGGGCTCTCAGDCGNCWTGCCGADCRDA